MLIGGDPTGPLSAEQVVNPSKVGIGKTKDDDRTVVGPADVLFKTIGTSGDAI